MSVRSPRTFRPCVRALGPALAIFFVIVFMPAIARAQDKSSHWGVRVSFVPSWEITDSLKKVIFEDNDTGTMKGSEFSIGVVRGSMLGGDWGVSFVRKPFDNESRIESHDQDCFNQDQTICRPRTEINAFDNVYLNAVEVHWFAAIHTFAQRVQVGFNIAGGIGSMNGNIIKTTDSFQPTGFGPNGPTGFTQIHEEEVLLAKDELLPVFPLFKLEAEGSIIVAPGLKVKIAGGVNFPAYSVRIGAVYLIGAK